jgi:DNA-binding XRE family transcriptional regulator
VAKIKGVKTKQRVTKAELARQLRISRAYVTMLGQGKRQPSRKLTRRLKKLTGEANLVNGVQVVRGSNPLTPTLNLK